ncbi:ABC transporter substrate-binding protein [Allokutzneria multivorans]|uniref:ABC transporter substrate-binding protein n=1 Tax=Allokutzneria multivorans TaxID=1142134 RepID=A0ABP7T202_9PSEU
MSAGRRLAGFLSALVCGGLLAAPVAVPAHAQQQQQPGPVLRVGLLQNIDSLNPFLAVFQSSTELGRLMYDFLNANAAKDNSPAPGLAEKWESSPDKLTWTYTIRSGAKWTDGTPITAKDVAFTYNLMVTNDAAATANGSFVSTFKSVTAKDERTLVIETKSPQATMLSLDVPIVPEHLWSKVSDIGKFANDQMPVVGSGPFILTEHKPDQFIRLKANKDYWRGAPKIDELQFLYFKNSDAAVQALRKGEVDLINRLTPTQYQALGSDANITLNKAPGRRFSELLINPGAATRDNVAIGDGNAALKDVRVRKAISQGIDTKALVERVLKGFGEQGKGIIPPVFSDFHWEPKGAEVNTFDPAAANKALDELGMRKGADGVRISTDGKPLKLRLYARNDRPNDVTSGEFIKQWMLDIGIAVDFTTISGNQMNEQTNTGNYDLAFSGWGTNPDPDYILSLSTCSQRPGADGKGGTTAAYMCDKTYDELYAKQLAEFDPAKRAELVKQAQARYNEVRPSLVLYYENALEAYRSDKFSGFTKQPEGNGVIREQNGVWGYYGAQPVGSSGSGGGSNTGVLIGVVIAVIVLGGIAIVVISKRRKVSSDDRE